MNKCGICDGSSYTLRDGKNICDDCGTEQAGFIELQSQEEIWEVDRSRFVTLNQSQIESDIEKEQDKVDEPTSNWNTYEMYDLILSKWVCALNNLGASEKLKPTVAMLWMAYLQKLEVAFLPFGKNSKGGIIVNKRDHQLLYSGASSVSASSIAHRKKIKVKEKSLEQIEKDKHDKIKRRIENRKLRKNKAASSNVSMSSFVINTLSKTINDIETSSQLSDESLFHGSIDTRKSNRIATKTSINYTTSKGSQSEDGMTLDDSCSEYAPSESDLKKIIPKSSIKRTKMINNWLQQKSKLYEEDSSAEEDLPLQSVSNPSSASGGWSSAKSARRYANRHMSYQEKRYAKNYHPQHLNHLKLLSLLYLAVLLTEEDLLLSDLLRWIREGHLPYLSSHHLLPCDMKVFLNDVRTTFTKQGIPTSDEVLKNAGKLAVFLNLKSIPLPTIPQIISKYVNFLKLPDMVKSMAQKIATEHPICESNHPEKLAIPCHENHAAVYIVFVLKAMYGLDGKNEVLLSDYADQFNKLFKEHECIDKSGILFSWSSWEQFINKVLWLSGQLDPACAQAQHGYYDMAKPDNEILAKFYWTDLIWQRTLTTRATNEVEYEMIQTLENSRNNTLEGLINQEKSITGTKEPFLGSIKQYLKSCNGIEGNGELIQLAENILKINYSSHIFDWHQDLEMLQSNINKCNAALIVKGPNSNSQESPEYKNGKLPKKRNIGQELNGETITIPQPLSQYKVQKEFVNCEKINSTSLKWLISSFALLYDLNTKELTKTLCKLEKIFQKKLSKKLSKK